MVVFFYENIIIFQVLWVILGLIVGSFVNVLIYRLPLMINNTKIDNKYINLIYPNSYCRHCHKPIKIFENIPVVSFLFLKGRCFECKNKINIQYPLVEIATAFLFWFSFHFFNISLEMVFVTWFLVTLLALTIIDIQHRLLPDILTLSLLWAGLLVNSNNTFTSINLSLYGAVIGYLSLWIVYWLFKIITKKDGLGYGDFKLLAAIGAWCGWKSLPIIILLSSLTGSLFGLTMILVFKKNRYSQIAFGPFLAIAGTVTFFWNDSLTAYWYLILGIPLLSP